jgi:Ca-activated chloride channel family protein
VRYSSLSLVRAALPPQAGWRRHVPAGLFLLALGSLVGALARPQAVVAVPTGRATILLAIDVSRSMCATDVLPSRLEAAKVAALTFIRRQSPDTQIGLVAFAGFAQLVQPASTDRQALESAVAALTTARGTAIGSGILAALDAIAELNPGTVQAIPVTGGDEAGALVPPAPEIVVLLTDGVTTTGMPPLEAAQRAAERGVRVFTIGFGTASGGAAWACGSFAGSNLQGGFMGGGGGGFRRGIDEDTLQDIAELTGGAYYAAESSGELEEVFRVLPTTIITKPELMEISVVFAALGALLALSAMLLALWWQPLP